MAKDPKEFERGESFFKKALIGTPAAVGAGIGIRRMVKDLQEAQARGAEIMYRKPLASVDAIAHATGISEEMIGRATAAREERLAFMSRNWDRFKTPEGMSVLKRSWLDAMRFADPISQTKLLSFTERVNLRGMTEPTDVFNAIQRTLEANNSSLMGRVFERFESNVVGFERHVLAGLDPMDLGTPFQFRPERVAGLDLLDLPNELGYRASKIAASLDANVGVTRYTRSDVFGKQSPEVFKLSFNQKGQTLVDLMVPVTQRGAFFEGEALRSKYVSTSVIVGNAEGGPKLMSREEYLLRQFEREIVPQIKSGQLTEPYEINAAVKQLRADILHKMENVKNLPPDLEDDAIKGYRLSRSEGVDIRWDLPERELEERRKKMLPGYHPTTRPATPEEIASIAKHPSIGKLFGGVSPANIAEGRRSFMDWSKIVSASPFAYDWGRRPEQFSREFALSEEAVAAIEREGYRESDIFATGRMRDLYKKGGLPPHLRVLYLNPEKHALLMEQLGIGRGEGLMREGLRELLEQRVFKSTNIVGMNMETLQKIQAGGQLLKGQVLGQIAETGLPFVVEDPESIKAAVGHWSEGAGDYVTIHQVNRHRLLSHEKWFNDLKMLARFTDEEVMQDAASRAGVSRRLVGEGFDVLTQVGKEIVRGQGFDVIASTEDLTKNPGLLTKQIVSGIHDTLSIRELESRGINFDFATLGVRPSPKIDKFLDHPLTFLRMWDRMSQTPEGAFDQQAFIKRAMKFSVEHAGLSPEEFGSAFGVIPEVEKEWQALTSQTLAGAGLRDVSIKEYIKAMEEGTAIGRAQLFWGGPARLRGAGGLGSIEPRLFEMLSGGVYGETGKELAKEFAERAVGTDPQKRALSEALATTMASIGGQIKRKKGEAIWDIAEQSIAEDDIAKQFETFLESGGGWMRAKKGAKEVFVPGLDNLTAMQPFTTAGGKGVRGAVPDIFYNMLYKGAEFAEGSLGEKAYERHMNESLAALWREAAPAGKGGGAWQRGKIAGSRFLEITSMVDGQMPAHANEVLVSTEKMKDMVNEMRQFMPKEEFEKFAAQAETGTMEGIVARHPFIGQYSAQPVTIRAIKTAKGTSKNMIAIQERAARVTFGFAGEKAQEKLMLMTPLLGMAADKDADEAALFLVRSKNADRLKAMMQGKANQFTTAYAQHQMRLQLLKASKAAGGAAGLSQSGKMAADVLKLGVTQSHVPKLSVELSMARQAVGHALTGQTEADARFLLEWLEQNPISAKHMNAREISEGGLRQLDTITNALKKKDSGTLIEEINKIVKDNEIARRFLKEDIMIQDAVMADDGTKLNISKRLKAINVEQTVRSLMDARHKFEKSGEAKLARIMAGRGPRMRPVQDLPRFLNAVQQTGNKAFSGVAKGMNTAANLLQAAGRTAIKHHKPIGLGFAGSIALAMTLSSPKDTIGPGANLDPGDVDMNQGQAAGKMKPADLMPPPQAMGSPQAPGMMHSPRAMIGPPVQSNRTRVVARTNYAMNTQNLASRINQMTNNRRSVNLSIRDRRSPADFSGGNTLY